MVICFCGMKEADVPLAREIGERMRKTRLAVFGIDAPQTAFARLMRRVQSDISRWERGERVPSVVEFVRYAQACGVAPEKILAGIAPARAEQLHLLSLEGIDQPAANVVRRLVDILRERRSRPTSTSARRRAS